MRNRAGRGKNGQYTQGLFEGKGGTRDVRCQMEMTHEHGKKEGGNG